MEIHKSRQDLKFGKNKTKLSSNVDAIREIKLQKNKEYVKIEQL